MFRNFLSRTASPSPWNAKRVAAFFALIVIGLSLAYFATTLHIDFDTFLNYFALGLLFFVLITIFYGIIAIHDVPYEIAKRRGHPHQDAIHAAGWVSLFTLHALWPFLWIWAMLYRPDRGWGFEQGKSEADTSIYLNKVDDLVRRIEVLEARQRPEKVANSGAEAQAATRRR